MRALIGQYHNLTLFPCRINETDVFLQQSMHGTSKTLLLRSIGLPFRTQDVDCPLTGQSTEILIIVLL